MSLAPGARLGPYEVLAPLGAGGMGEVYKARDHRLGRLVAVKVLPAAAATSAEARERFEREARAISRLSHPNVCAIFDVGTEGDTLYLVMELLDGQTLASLVSRGPLPLPEVLRIGQQIADALAGLAREGITHRDLKPANVMLTRSGVKLLDFGLAKTAAASHHAANVTTMAEITAPGTWLGTAPYMSPEQCEGAAVDTRSDVFALGAVLYEMATGKRAFAGESAAGITSSILRVDPRPPSSIRSELPADFDRLVGECLAKHPDRRWQSAHDVALQLAAIAEGTKHGRATAPQRRPLLWLAWIGSIAAAALAAVATMQLIGAGENPVTRLAIQISPPEGNAFVYDSETVRFALSPDGKRLAFIASGPASAQRVWLRSLSSVDDQPVAGTDGATSVFWSPDSRSIAFVAGNLLKRLELVSGVAVTICEVPRQIGFYGTWSRSGQILYAVVSGEAIYQVSAAGGNPVAVMNPDPSRDETRVVFPAFLPDGQRFLYLTRHRDGRDLLMLGESGKASRELMPMESNVQYMEPGVLVFVKGGALVGQSFDVSRGTVSGEPFAISAEVRFFMSTSAADFSASPNGTLVFQPHEDLSRLAWFDRTGRETGRLGPSGGYLEVRFDRAGQTVFTSRTLPSTGAYDVWSFDIARNTETRLTFDDAFTEIEGILAPARHTMIFGSARGSPPRLTRRDLQSGKDAPLLPGRAMQGVGDVSPDERILAYEERTDEGTFDLWTVPLIGPATPTAIRQTSSNETGFRFAPDGIHYTFNSDESGRPEVYLASLAETGKTMVSSGGGFEARWRRDGRELYYVSPDLRIMSVAVEFTPVVTLGTPATLFAVPSQNWSGYDVSADGKRFLVIIPEVIASEQPLTAIINALARK